MAKITNVGNTLRIAVTCKCGSWIEHWEKFSEMTRPDYCIVFPLCLKKDIVGAHVQKANSDDKDWYIVPLCKKHSRYKASKILEISDIFPLVKANRGETCGY
jgi:hypothetical protein